MNRDIVLHCVRKHLEADLIEPMAARSLGEIVHAIAIELRDKATIQSDTVGLTAIPLVAAFVDGEVSHDEEQLVCRAVLGDNSVLAEVVASVRAQLEHHSLPPLQQNLVDRLLELVHQQAEPAEENSDVSAVLPSLHPFETPDVVAVAIDPALAAGSPAAIETPLPRGHSSNSGLFKRRKVTRALLWASGIAALALLAFEFGLSSWLPKRQDTDGTLVQQPNSQMPIEDTSNDKPVPAMQPEPDQGNSGKRLLAQIEPMVEESTAASETALDNDSASLTPTTEPSEMGTPLPPPTLKNSQRYEFVDKGLGDLHWAKIQGVLARRQDSTSNAIESGLHRWTGVESGTSIARSDFESRSLYLSTLPLSRAEAEFSSGGKLVLAPDSSLAVSQGDSSHGHIYIERGGVALVDLPMGSMLEVFLEDRSLAMLRWRSQGTLVLLASSTGILAQIDGSIECADSVFEDSVLQLGEKVEKLSAKAKTPAWVNRNVDPLGLPKGVLAQLSSSSDLINTLEQLSREPISGTDPLTWASLSNWVAQSSGRDLNQVFANGSFVQRSVAIDRLLLMPAWTSSHRRMWQALVASSQNPEQVRAMMVLTEQLRRKLPLGAMQVERLLKTLENPDPATRSLADALLRRNFGSGPNYNPILPQANAPRSIQIWRRFISAR